MEPRSYRQKATPGWAWVVLGLLAVGAVAIAGAAVSAGMGPDAVSGWDTLAGFLLILFVVMASLPIAWILAGGLGRIALGVAWVIAIAAAALLGVRPGADPTLSFEIFILVPGVLVTTIGGLVVMWALAAGSGRLELDAEEIRYYPFASDSLRLWRLRWREICAVRIVRNLFGSHAFSAAYLSAPGRVTQRIILSRFEDSQTLQADLLRAVDEARRQAGGRRPAPEMYDLGVVHLVSGVLLYGAIFLMVTPVVLLVCVVGQLGEAGDALYLIAALVTPAAFAYAFWVGGLLALTSGPPRPSDAVVIGLPAGLFPAHWLTSGADQSARGWYALVVLYALVALGGGIAGAWIWTRLIKPRTAEPRQ